MEGYFFIFYLHPIYLMLNIVYTLKEKHYVTSYSTY